MNQGDREENRTDLSDWECERFVLNELDEARMRQIRRAAQVDESLRKRLEAIEHSNHEILREYPSDQIGQQVRNRLAGHSSSAVHEGHRWPGWLPVPGLVASGLMVLLALTVFVLPGVMPDRNPTPAGENRIKGASQQLRLYRKTESGSQQLSNGDRAAEHDLIRLQVQTAKPVFAAILSLDGRGRITRHLPVEGSNAVELTTQSAFLDSAYELDDAPHWEMFVLVTAAKEFPVAEVLKALQESWSTDLAMQNPPSTLNLPEGRHVTTFTLRKDSSDEE